MVRSHTDGGRPMGPPAWTQRTGGQLGLEQTLRPLGKAGGVRKVTTEHEANKGSRHLYGCVAPAPSANVESVVASEPACWT